MKVQGFGKCSGCGKMKLSNVVCVSQPGEYPAQLEEPELGLWWVPVKKVRVYICTDCIRAEVAKVFSRGKKSGSGGVS